MCCFAQDVLLYRKKDEIEFLKSYHRSFFFLSQVKAAVYFDYMRSYGVWNCVWTIACYMLQTGFSLGSSLWLSAWSNDALDPDKALDPHVRDVRLGVYGGLGAGESELVTH